MRTTGVTQGLQVGIVRKTSGEETPARQGLFKMLADGKVTEKGPDFYRKLFLAGLKRILGIRFVKNLNAPRAEIDQPKWLVLKGHDFSTELLRWSGAAGNLLAFAAHDQYK